MCYFLGFGPFASTPTEPATERSHSQLGVQNDLTLVWLKWPRGAATVYTLPMNHGLDPCPLVTVGPLRGRKNMSGGFRVDKIT